MINGHGDDLHQFKGKIKHNFSSNVYYKGCSEFLLNALNAKLGRIENYPSPAASELNVLAARHFSLRANQFLFTNGATEAFYLIAQKYKNKTVTIVGPTFAEYEDACKINEMDITLTLWKDLKTAQFKTDLAFICNPNNPDGAILSKAVIESLLIEFPNTHFIIDEAYYEFTDKKESVLSLIQNYTNITIARSLTKTFAIPGLRLGYLVSNDQFITELLAFKMPWSVNAIAIEAGQFIFYKYDQLMFNVSELIERTAQFKAKVNSLAHFDVMPGHTTYFLVKLLKGKAPDLKDYLIDNFQILVRDATNFNGLEGEYIRLSLQSEESNELILKALNQWN